MESRLGLAGSDRKQRSGRMTQNSITKMKLMIPRAAELAHSEPLGYAGSGSSLTILMVTQSFRTAPDLGRWPMHDN